MKNRPETTGEYELSGKVLTMIRKQPGGDFKLVKGFPRLATDTDYRFLCNAKKRGLEEAFLRVIWIDGGKYGVLGSHRIRPSDEWIDVNLPFRSPAPNRKVVVQFFPGDDVDGRLSVTQMVLLPASQAGPVHTILSPVTVEKTLRPEAKAVPAPGLTPYEEQSLLLNGDFSRPQPGLKNMPLFWRHAHLKDAPEHWRLYSLRGGRFVFRAPFYFGQTLDITPESPTTYTLRFTAAVESGSLLAVVGYRRLFDARDRGIISQTYPAGEGWRTHELKLKVAPELKAGCLMVKFYAKGDDGSVELDEVILLPDQPASPAETKGLFLNGQKNRYPASGICVPASPSYYELRAAKYLRKYLFLASGQYLDILLAKPGDVQDKSGLFYLGDEFFDDRELADLGPGGFVVKGNSGQVRIGGRRDDDGVIQGVFGVLRRLGFHFYTEADFEPPTEAPLCLSELELRREPAFGLRFAGGSRRTSFNALGYSDPFLVGDPGRIGRWKLNEHTASFLVDPILYFQDHPEYYAMSRKGKRLYPRRGPVDIHLCVSNPKTQRIAIDNMLRWVELEPWAKVFFVAPGDGHGWCQCQKCRSWDVGSSDPAQGYLSDRNLRFVNLIAREVAEKHPDKLIATLAYCGCRRAPLQEKPEPNVVFYYCTYPPVWKCNRHAFCPENLRGWEEYHRWIREHPGQVFVYDYGANGKTPMGGLYASIQKLRQYAAAGVRGVRFCGYDSFHKEFDYIMGRLLWESKAHVESELDRFMRFYYGKDAFPPFRDYFSLLTETEMAKSLHRPDAEGCLVDRQLGYVTVDYEFFRQAKPMLERALDACGESDDEARQTIERQKLKLLTEYVMNYSKASGLKDAALEEFARNLKEMVELNIKHKWPYPVWWLSMRELLATRAQLDIGDAEPWHKSPVIGQLLDDPVALIAKPSFSYRETPSRLRFDVAMMAGGEGLRNYQYEKKPRTVRAYAKVLRRASSPYSKLATTFELDDEPAREATLKLEGLDDDKPGKAVIEVLVNGESVFKGANTFDEDDWSVMTFRIPAVLLKQGENRLLIRNLTQDRGGNVGTVQLVEKPSEDYSWGWVLFTSCELTL